LLSEIRPRPTDSAKVEATSTRFQLEGLTVSQPTIFHVLHLTSSIYLLSYISLTLRVKQFEGLYTPIGQEYDLYMSMLYSICRAGESKLGVNWTALLI